MLQLSGFYTGTISSLWTAGFWVIFIGVFGWFGSPVPPWLNKELPFTSPVATGCLWTFWDREFHEYPCLLSQRCLLFTTIRLLLPTFWIALGSAFPSLPEVGSSCCGFFSTSPHKIFAFLRSFSRSASRSCLFETLPFPSCLRSWSRTSSDTHQSVLWPWSELGIGHKRYESLLCWPFLLAFPYTWFWLFRGDYRWY